MTETVFIIDYVQNGQLPLSCAGIIRARATVYLHVSSLNAQPWQAWPRSLGVVHSTVFSSCPVFV